MDARSELLTYMGVAAVTIAALFGLQMWYASYLDTSVIHAPSHAPLNPQVVTVREDWHQKLASAPVPIDKAKQLLAERGRTAFPKIAAVGSTDLSAMSGWMHRPGFKPYEPRKQPEPPPAEVAPVEAQPAAAPAAAPAPAAPAPAAPAKPTRAPRVPAPAAPAAHP